ncbi:MAG TPA: 30S ribosomal protein S16 [Oligoflexia bacterium]|nr:30S ribosomal protein S16 [Oligoflexia bacterium]HMP48483.1 30S ribosomal protein S16 [Oligoflexia bacterium]
MSVHIRLARLGRKNLPFYRIVAADKDAKRDGRYIEVLGTFNPVTNPPTVDLKEDRVKYWVGVGAQLTETTLRIVEKQIPGYVSGILEGRTKKLQAKRASRKKRAKA